MEHRFRVTMEFDSNMPRDIFNALSLLIAKNFEKEYGGNELVYVATEIVDPKTQRYESIRIK